MNLQVWNPKKKKRKKILQKKEKKTLVLGGVGGGVGVPYRRCCRRSSSFFLLHCAALRLQLLLLLLLLRRCWVAATAAALPPARLSRSSSLLPLLSSLPLRFLSSPILHNPHMQTSSLFQKKLRWLLRKETNKQGRTDGRSRSHRRLPAHPSARHRSRTTQ